MKLRIKGNSLRLRLTRAEVARIAAGQVVEEIIKFGSLSHQQLIYRLETSHNASDVTARFADGRIVVVLPFAETLRWATNDAQIGISAEQPLNAVETPDTETQITGEVLKLLIEKDFACLKGDDNQREEDDEDAFPNPHHQNRN